MARKARRRSEETRTGAKGAKNAATEMAVTQDISMGMFLLKLQQHPHEPVRPRFKDVDAEAPSAQQELEYT